jgi:hypothetical protein
LWKFSREFFPNAFHVFIAANLVIFFQADLHECGVGRGITRVDGGEIRRQANVRYDHAKLIRGHDTSDDVLHLIYVLFRIFDSGPGWHLDIDKKLTRIRAWEERDSHERIES